MKKHILFSSPKGLKAINQIKNTNKITSYNLHTWIMDSQAHHFSWQLIAHSAVLQTMKTYKNTRCFQLLVSWTFPALKKNTLFQEFGVLFFASLAEWTSPICWVTGWETQRLSLPLQPHSTLPTPQRGVASAAAPWHAMMRQEVGVREQLMDWQGLKVVYVYIMEVASWSSYRNMFTRYVQQMHIKSCKCLWPFYHRSGRYAMQKSFKT